MSLLDFLKRKKQIDKSKEEKKEEKKPEKKSEKVLGKEDVHTIKSSEGGVPPEAGQFNRVKVFSYDVVKEPHISEKSTGLSEKDKYVFKVYSNKNKSEIKKSVEGIYGVHVISVNIIKIPAKKRRLGRTEGFRKRYVKAVVTVKKGQKIEIF